MDERPNSKRLSLFETFLHLSRLPLTLLIGIRDIALVYIYPFTRYREPSSEMKFCTLLFGGLLLQSESTFMERHRQLAKAAGQYGSLQRPPSQVQESPTNGAALQTSSSGGPSSRSSSARVALDCGKICGPAPSNHGDNVSKKKADHSACIHNCIAGHK